MKKLSTSFFMRAAIAIALLFATTGTAAAWDFMYNGLAYNYDGDGTSVYVTYTSTNSDNYGGSLTNVVIPAKITLEGNVSYNVTGIGQYAFSNCTNLQSITIPSSVKTIGEAAFYNTNIKKLTVSSVDAWLNTTLNSAIPTPHEMYVGSSLLTNLTIPSGKTSVGQHFYNVTSIKSVTIPNSVTEIGTSAFNNCTSLATLNLGTGVQTIGQGAFSGCAALTSVTFPVSLKTIGFFAFGNCSSLTSLTIPENIETIEHNVFEGCTNVKTLTWNAINLSSNGGIPTANIETVTIGSKVQTIPNNFVSNSKIKAVAFHSSVKTIGSSAFNNCINLTSVSIPNGCTVSSLAFANCSALQSVTIPATINVSNTNIFQNCNSIKKLTWNATNVSSQFVPTANIEQVTIGSGVKELPQNFLQNAKITSLFLPSNLTTIGSYAFQNCSGLSSLSLPSGLATIGSYAFQNCYNLTSLTIPENLTSVGDNAFSGCNNITQLTWNAIDLSTNGGLPASNITKVTIGSSVKTLPASFVKGSKITAVTIPSSVTCINTSAFESCSLLTSVSILSRGWSYGYGRTALFKNCTSLKTIDMSNAFVTYINDEMFYGCTSLSTVRFSSYVTGIGSSAFYGCSNLSTLTIPASVTSIGNSAFYDCRGLKAITIPDNVKSIGESAFAYCTSLKRLILREGIQTIGRSSFSSTIIQNLTIPSSVQTIEDYAFSSCPIIKLKFLSESVHLATTSVNSQSQTNVFGSGVWYIVPTLKLVVVPNSTFLNPYNNLKRNSTVEIMDPNTSFEVDGITYVITDMTNRKVKIVDIDETKCATDIEVKKVKYRNVEFTPTEIGVAAVAANYTVQNFNVGDIITNLPEYSFYSCDALRSIDMKNTQTIGQYAFAESGLTKASIPNSTQTIGQHAFENCKRMTEFVTGTGLTTVDQYVLAGCSALRRVELGANVTTINANSFNGCSKIKTLRVRRTTPPTATSGVFNDLDKWTCTLYVPTGTVDTYKTANEWKTFFFISDSETEPSEGDVNGDGNVNVTDVTTLVNMILGVVEKDETAADVDGNGVVNVSDVTALVNLILGVG